jgi:hypothetical protein
MHSFIHSFIAPICDHVSCSLSWLFHIVVVGIVIVIVIVVVVVVNIIMVFARVLFGSFALLALPPIGCFGQTLRKRTHALMQALILPCHKLDTAPKCAIQYLIE